MGRALPGASLGPAEYARPYAWWGWHWSPPVPMSIVEIAEAGTLDRRLAAVLWLLLEARRSLILASEPPMSGKTTMLSALLAFLPADTRLVFLRGLSETFDYTRQGEARTSYLLVNELSDHLPVYLWGPKATRMFATLRDGYGLGATMHADDVAEVLAQLREELGLSANELACLDVIGIMRILNGQQPIVGHDDMPPELRYGSVARRLVATHLVVRRGDRITTPLISEWDARSDEHRLALEPVLDDLARRCGRSVSDFCAALADREALLAELATRGIRRPREVQEAIAAYGARRRGP